MLKSLKYLGVDIFPSLYSTIVKDFWGILRRVEADEKMVTFILPILFLICYLMPYVLCPLSVWLDPIALVSWRTIQENLALPHRLQDLVYSNVLYLQTIQAGLCSVFTFINLAPCKEKATPSQWHVHSPIFHNFAYWWSFFLFSPSGVKEVSVLCQIARKKSFILPGSSFFFYL